jgi:L-ascorbate oxidase
LVNGQPVNHPFHIHVNPFEVVRITKTVGDKEIDIFDNGHCTELDLKDPKTGKPSPDPQYCDQIGVFRDTIFVKSGYQIYARSHYTDFDGAFVLHCHILDHEDKGMMQNVIIQDPQHPSIPTAASMDMETHPMHAAADPTAPSASSSASPTPNPSGDHP